jgi:hypothetical protein
MSVEITNLLIFVILGIPLLLQYLSVCLMPDINDLWSNTNNNNNTKNIIKEKPGLEIFYKITMTLSFLAGFYLVYYLVAKIQNKEIFGNYDQVGKYVIYGSLLTLVGFSLLWLPCFYLSEKWVTSIVLFIVSVSSLVLFVSLLTADNRSSASGSKAAKDVYDNVAIGCAFMLLFQHFIMDFCIWSLSRAGN